MRIDVTRGLAGGPAGRGTKMATRHAQAEPLRFTLSKGDTSLPRGTSFDFEATLSKAKPADQAVVLYFRPLTAGAAWRQN